MTGVGTVAGSTCLGRGGVVDRWEDPTGLDAKEADGCRAVYRGVADPATGLVKLDDDVDSAGRAAEATNVGLLVGGVDETAVDVLDTVGAVVIGSRISSGDTATDDVTIELLFGVEWTMVETVEPILDKGEAAAEMFLGVAWWPALVMLKLAFDVA